MVNLGRGAALGALIAGVMALSGPAAAQVQPDPRVQAAFEAVEEGDYAAAEAAARISGREGTLDLVEWHRLRAGQVADMPDPDWSDYIRFLSRHPDWPGLARLRRVGEQFIPQGANPIAVVSYFESVAPATSFGALQLATAYRALGREAEARAVVIRAWHDLYIEPEVEAAILRDWSAVLQGQHWARVDQAIWDSRLGEAERGVRHLSRDQQALARARIALRRGNSGVDALIAAIPGHLRSDPGLAFDRFDWRYSKRRTASARELLLEHSTSPEALGRPEAWGPRRRILARRAMREGNAELAYRLAANHHMTEGYAPADMEWVAGYVALQDLDQPARAARHFEQFLSFVETPISLARGYYWLGRAEEARGNVRLSQAAYRRAGQFQTTFYGQLGAERIGMPVDQSVLGSAQRRPNWEEASFRWSPLLAYADIAHQGGDWVTTELFLTRIALDLDDPLEMEKLAQYAIDQYDRADTAVRLSKRAARDGQIFPNTAYPLTDLAGYTGGVPAELVKSLARQESELNPQAESHAGALGLMQVMPRTAQQVAREIGLPYSKDRLTDDWEYNARIGTTYLSGLLDDFDGSIVLSAAGYNAGPHRSRQWIERYGDPRSMDPDEVIDWIESIPFSETRNYVQRVVEGMHVYRMRLEGRAVPLQIVADLTRG
ncbi:MAG: lytic transglycosylase domain-containing protein [Pseudomonadota bacterium]